MNTAITYFAPPSPLNLPGTYIGGTGGQGEVMLHDFHVAMVYWLERIFEIRNHIHENGYQK